MTSMVSSNLWRILALLLLGFAVFEAVKYGLVAALVLLLFLLLPDVALIGAFDPQRRGALLPSRVAFYNALHRPYLPMAMMLAAVLLPLPPLGLGLRGGLELFLAGLAWLAHIAIDRAFGYGLRAADGGIHRRQLQAGATPGEAQASWSREPGREEATDGDDGGGDGE